MKKLPSAGATIGTFILRAAALVILLYQIPAPTIAQGLNLASGSKDKPIEIFADNGIEWQKDKGILIASGNAKASRDGVNVEAEVLRAYYRKKVGGGTDLYRLEAAGGVKIFTRAEYIIGQSAVWDFEQAILKVEGKKVVYKTGNDSVTATRQMEYWERQLMVVARGNSVAIHEGKVVRGNILKALIRKKKTGKSEVYMVEAFDNVLIVSDKDQLRADRGIYQVDSGTATLTSNVTITRGKTVLSGDKAVINLNTGISKLLTVDRVRSKTRRKKRVHGLIFPHKK